MPGHVGQVGRVGMVGGRRRGGGGGGAPAPILFAFSDDFNSGEAKLYRRPGWQYRADDARVQTSYNIASQRLASNDGRNIFPLFGRDLGYLGGWAEARYVGVNLIQFIIVNYVDRLNYIFFNIGNAGRAQVIRRVAGVNTTIYDSGGGAGLANGQVVRLTYSWNPALSTMALAVTADGVVPAWAAMPANGILQTTSSSQLRPSGLVGVAGGTTVDDFACGHTSPVKPRLSVDRISRVWQQHKTAANKAIPLAGDCSGVTGILYRLVKAGVLVSGWDWAALPGVTINAGRWSATTPTIPADNGYEIELQATDDAMARTRTESFSIGDVYFVWGQSNAAPMAGGSAGAQPTSGLANCWIIGGESDPVIGPINRTGQSRVFTSPFDTAATGYGFLAPMRSACPDTRALAFEGQGLGSSRLVLFLSSSSDTGGGTKTRWQAFSDAIDAVGGDCAGVVWSQGEEDCGRSLTTNQFGAPEEAQYRSDLVALATLVRTKCGRTASELPWPIMGLGRFVSGTAGNAYALDASRDRFRKMQWDLCEGPGAIAGFWFAGSQIDIAQGDADHYSDVIECSRRAGAAMARAKGWATKDRRGPVVTGATFSGNDIVVALDMQLSTALTCSVVPSPAVNFVFRDASNAVQTALSMTIGTAQVTFTFATPPAAGWTVNTTGGANPIIAGVLKGTQPDGIGVMNMPMFAGPITL